MVDSNEEANLIAFGMKLHAPCAPAGKAKQLILCSTSLERYPPLNGVVLTLGVEFTG